MPAPTQSTTGYDVVSGQYMAQYGTVDVAPDNNDNVPAMAPGIERLIVFQVPYDQESLTEFRPLWRGNNDGTNTEGYGMGYGGVIQGDLFAITDPSIVLNAAAITALTPIATGSTRMQLTNGVQTENGAFKSLPLNLPNTYKFALGQFGALRLKNIASDASTNFISINNGCYADSNNPQIISGRSLRSWNIFGKDPARTGTAWSEMGTLPRVPALGSTHLAQVANLQIKTASGKFFGQWSYEPGNYTSEAGVAPSLLTLNGDRYRQEMIHKFAQVYDTASLAAVCVAVGTVKAITSVNGVVKATATLTFNQTSGSPTHGDNGSYSLFRADAIFDNAAKVTVAAGDHTQTEFIAQGSCQIRLPMISTGRQDGFVSIDDQVLRGFASCQRWNGSAWQNVWRANPTNGADVGYAHAVFPFSLCQVGTTTGGGGTGGGTTTTGSPTVIDDNSLHFKDGTYDRIEGGILWGLDGLQNAGPGQGTANTWVGFRFTAWEDGVLDHFQYNLSKDGLGETGHSAGTFGTHSWECYDTDANLNPVTGNPIGVGVVSNATLNAQDYPTCTPSTKPVLVKGKRYVWICKNTDGDPTNNFVGIQSCGTTADARGNRWLDPRDFAVLFTSNGGGTWLDGTRNLNSAMASHYWEPVVELTMGTGTKFGCGAQLSGNVAGGGSATRTFHFTAGNYWETIVTPTANLLYSGFALDTNCSVAGKLQVDLLDANNNPLITPVIIDESAAATSVQVSFGGYNVEVYKRYRFGFGNNAVVAATLGNKIKLRMTPLTGTWVACATRDNRSSGFSDASCCSHHEAWYKATAGGSSGSSIRADVFQTNLNVDGAYDANWRTGLFIATESITGAGTGGGTGGGTTPPVLPVPKLNGTSDARQGLGTNVTAAAAANTIVQPIPYSGAVAPVGVWKNYTSPATGLANPMNVLTDGSLEPTVALDENTEYIQMPTGPVPLRMCVDGAVTGPGYAVLMMGAVTPADLLYGTGLNAIFATVYFQAGQILVNFWSNNGSGGLVAFSTQNGAVAPWTSGTDFYIVLTPNIAAKTYTLTLYGADGKTPINWTGIGAGVTTNAFPSTRVGTYGAVSLNPGNTAGSLGPHISLLEFNWAAPVTAPVTTISGVTLTTPAQPTKQANGTWTLQSTATVQGTGNPPQAISWGTTFPGATISANGLLTIPSLPASGTITAAATGTSPLVISSSGTLSFVDPSIPTSLAAPVLPVIADAPAPTVITILTSNQAANVLGLLEITGGTTVYTFSGTFQNGQVSIAANLPQGAYSARAQIKLGTLTSPFSSTVAFNVLAASTGGTGGGGTGGDPPPPPAGSGVTVVSLEFLSI